MSSGLRWCLSDIEMPRMDGSTSCATSAPMSAWPDLPVIIMITAYAEKNTASMLASWELITICKASPMPKMFVRLLRDYCHNELVTT